MIIQSPLNYAGGKYKLLPQIIPLFPRDINLFVDLFCGGGNVGINVISNKVLYNDINRNIIHLFQMFKNVDKSDIFAWIWQTIQHYELSYVCEYGYEYYHCNSYNGLGKYNKEKFNALRDDFNKRTKEAKFDHCYYVMLYVLVVYAFNNQIRFNSRGEYNLPVGKRDFNLQMQQKLSAFIDKLKGQENEFMYVDFQEFDISILTSYDLVYVDPPYLITCASYNEQGGWSEEKEQKLLLFLNRLDERHIRFTLSNVLRSKGKQNDILICWLEKNKERYNIHHLNYNYSNSSYHTKDRVSKSEEVLITNY